MLLPMRHRNPREKFSTFESFLWGMVCWAVCCTETRGTGRLPGGLTPPGDTHFSKATKKVLGHTQFAHRHSFYFACITRQSNGACPLVDEKVSNVDEMASQILGLKSALVIYTWCEQAADTLTTSAPPYPVSQLQEPNDIGRG